MFARRKGQKLIRPFSITSGRRCTNAWLATYVLSDDAQRQQLNGPKKIQPRYQWCNPREKGFRYTSF